MKTIEVLLTSVVAPQKTVHPQKTQHYLGFKIRPRNDGYVATPRNWSGRELRAATLPELRTLIWRWWHQVK